MRYHSQNPADSRMHRVSTEGADKRVAEHFVLGAFQCTDGTDILLLHPRLVALCQAIRDRVGGPVYVNSGFRTHAFNRQIGGAPGSKHLIGGAGDLWSDVVTPEEIARIAERLGAGGIGRYDTFTHVDVIGRWRRWNNRAA